MINDDSAGGKLLGQATGGGGLAWRDGALQGVRLGGTTMMEGDLDLKGHRILNFDHKTPDIDNLEVRRISMATATAVGCSERKADITIWSNVGKGHTYYDLLPALFTTIFFLLGWTLLIP